MTAERPPPRELRLTGHLQGTVRSCDALGAGEVLLDDGTVVPFGPGAVSGVRALARGQRVDLHLDDSGSDGTGGVRAVRLVGT